MTMHKKYYYTLAVFAIFPFVNAIIPIFLSMIILILIVNYLLMYTS